MSQNTCVSVISRAFIMAVEFSRSDSANFLLDTGINVNFHHPNGIDTPLMAATFYDHPYLVNRLIVAGAIVNAINGKGQAAVHLAKTKEVGGSNPGIPPLLKHACGEGNWLLCGLYTPAEVLHQR